MVKLKVFSDELRAKINSDITALELILRKEKQPSIFDTKMEVKLGQIQFSFNTPPFDYIEKREIEKCFKSIVASVQDYMDQLLAIKLTIKNYPYGVIRPRAVNNYLSNQYQTNLLKVSTDSRLNTTKKISELVDKTQEEHKLMSDSLQSLFYIRNGLEHHKGIAKVDRQLKFRRIAFVSTSGKELQFPGTPGENEGLHLSLIDENIPYDKGQNIIITKDLLYLIVQSLILYTISILGKMLSKDLENFRNHMSIYDNSRS